MTTAEQPVRGAKAAHMEEWWSILHEGVPIKSDADAETNALPFCIESEIT
jgi:hypothetical protein